MWCGGPGLHLGPCPVDLRWTLYQNTLNTRHLFGSQDLVSGDVLVVVGSYVSVLADLLSSCTAYVPTGPPHTGLW